ncbi:MAG: NlpC/P60 family protein [Aureispira sp.]
MSSPSSLFGQVQLPCLPIRAAAQHSSEQVNQLLFQETYTILEQQTEWSYICSQHDQYEGWIANNQVHFINKEAYERPFLSYQTNLAHWDLERHSFCYMGSPSYEYAPVSETVSPNDACRAALSFVNTPYLWGGRTCSGIDCSGLMQIAFRMAGKALPRDASQQAQLGNTIPWEAHQRGDLAFFENKKGKITHVGLLLDQNTLVHASAWVRIDPLTKEGIWHQKQCTHQLAHIQRLT